MNFWDVFVLRTYLGFDETEAGRQAAGRILDRAHARGWFQPPTLHPQARLALFAAAAPGTPLANQAHALWNTQFNYLDIARLIAHIDEQRGSQIRELLAIAEHSTPTSARILNGILYGGRPFPVAVNFHLFVARAQGIAPASATGLATTLFNQALVNFNAAAMPRSAFLRYLYAHALTALTGGAAIPPTAAQHTAPWFLALDPGERHFLNCCEHDPPLDPDRVRALYLHFYAGLTTAQITDLWNEIYPTYSWWEGDIIELLESAWDAILT